MSRQYQTFVPTDIVQTIETSDLSAPIYRTARRLLDIAATQNGNVILDRDAMCQLCGDAIKPAADATMRTHLIALQKAGIIQYHTNHMVSARFIGWPQAPTTPPIDDEEMIDTRSDMIVQRSQSPEPMIDQRSDVIARRSSTSSDMIAHRSNTRAERSQQKSRSPSDQIRASDDQIRALGDHFDHQLVGCLFDIPITTDRDTNNHDEPPQPPAPYEISPDDQKRGFEMLVDPEVGIAPKLAQKLAARVHPSEIVRQIAAWLPARQAGRQQTGLLIKRITERWGAPEPTSDFKDSEFYRRHFPEYLRYGDWNEIAQPTRNYRPDEYADVII